MKRIVSLLLTICISVSLMIPVKAGVTTYNINAAVSYAKSHWDDGVGACADFCSACLRAGGINVNISTTRTLMNYLVDNGYASTYLLTTAQGVNLKWSSYSDRVSPGDIIINYCSSCKVYPHVVFVSDDKSDGYIRQYAHNSAKNNKKYYTGSEGYDSHPGHSFDTYVIHINNSIYGDVPQPKPSHTHSYTQQIETSHPHNVYNVCSCGEKLYVGKSSAASCTSCYPLGYVSLTRSFEKTKGTAIFYRNDVNNATSFTLKLYKDNSLYGTYNMSGTSYSVSGLPAGSYSADLTAKNSNTGESKSAYCTSFKIVNTYTVSYNANGGTNAPSSQTKIEDTPLTLTSAIPTKEGHIFKGWASSKNATEAQYQAGGTYTKNAKIILYAVWEPETYTITFDTNGGIGTVKSETVTYGNTIKMPNSIVKDYSYLIGWSTNKNAATPDYKLGIDCKIKNNLTLYAVWGEAAWNNEISDSLSGSGTEENPYLISTAADLAYLANKVNMQSAAPTYEYYKLTDNINLTYTEWVPIGVYNNENQYFYGSFDGNGYTISDLYMTKENQGYVGLFGYVKNSEFKNLTVTGAIEGISSSNTLNIGGIIGYADNSNLVGLSSKYFNIGSIATGTADYSAVGTAVGKTIGGTIENCEAYNSNINLKSGKFISGMIAGYCGSDITNCRVESTEGGLFSTSAAVGSFYMGGLCGMLTKNADKCIIKAPYFSNNIKTTDISSVGGLVGELGGTAKICSVQFDDSSENSITSTGTGTVKAGGFVGNMTADAKITDCKFDGKTISETTTSSSAYTGGLAGYATAKTNPTVSVCGGNSLSYANLPKKDGYKATWYTDSTFTSPYDFSQQVTSNLTLYAKWEKGDDTPDIWDGTSAEPAYNADTKTYTITNGEELAWLSDVTNGVITSGTNFPTVITFEGYTIELANDIYLNDVSDVDNWGTSAPANNWTPIGEYNKYPGKPFCGTFNGNDNSVYGIYINSSGDNCGLFGYVKNATIKQICVQNSFITGSGSCYGGIVGDANDSAILDSVNYAEICGDHCIGGIAGAGYIVSNCMNYGEIKGKYLLGGIVGANDNYITGCHNYGTVTGTSRNVGGISGSVDGEIAECSNHAEIRGSTQIGGIVGYCSGTIKNSYNLSVVKADVNYVGGIVGYADVCDIKYCYNTGSLIYCYDTVCVGGITGYMQNSTVSYCYNSGYIGGNDYVGGLIGLCTPGGGSSSAQGSVTVKYSYNVGTLSCSNNKGGIVGYWSYNGTYKLYLKYCHAYQDTLYSSSDYGSQYVSITSCNLLKFHSYFKDLSNLTGFSTSDWGTDSSINSGYPYLKALEETYKTYTVTAVVDEDNSAINRAFVNVDGDISATASQNAFAGSVLGYGYGSGNAASVNKNIVGMADNVLSETTGSSYTAYTGNVIGINLNNKFGFENVYYNSEMNVESSTNTIDTTGIARSSKTMNTAFYTNLLGLTPYTSVDGLQEDESAVWILENGKLPELYYNCLNDITISQDIQNGTISVDKTQAVDNEIVTVTATPNENYILNKIYVNGEEIDGTTFEVSGDSEIFAIFSERIPEFNVTISENDNATGTLVNVDSTEPMLMSVMSASDESGSSITAKDGEEIQINTTANTDYTVDTIYVNGEEIVSDSFILTDNTVVTMEVASISTDITAVTNDAEDVSDYFAVVSGSVSGDTEGISRYIRYWSADDAETVYTTDIEAGAGEYSVELMGLESNTTYYYQMTEKGEIKSFTTSEEPVEDIVEDDNPTDSNPITTTTYKKLNSTYKFTITVENALNDENVYAAIYNSDGVLLGIGMTAFDGDVETTVNLPIVSGASYAKIFVWNEQMQPAADAEIIEMTE